MTAWYFPDTTVLCNFAAIARLDVLEKVLASRGRWTEAVAYETRRSARFLPELESVIRAGWLGDPIEITRKADIDRVEAIRRGVFGGSARQPTRHLGEAQTLFVLQRPDEFRHGVWITDDREAFEYAMRRGIATYDTVDVMRAAVAAALVTADEGLTALGRMVAAGRKLRRLPRRVADLS
jgi:hypothetical protein